MSYKEGDSPNCGFVLSLNEDGSNQYPRIWVQVNGAWLAAEQATAIPLNTWIHLTGTYDGAAIRLYRNGLLVATTVANGSMSQCTQGTRIGNRAPGGWNAQFPGALDEVRVYNRGLSAGEIASLATGTSITAFVYGRGGLDHTVDGAGNVTYRLADTLGSTTNLLDTYSNVTATYQYDIFGAARYHSGASTEFSFTGEQNDANGLEYLRARYYDPGTGRFLSRDPHPASAWHSQTLNRYVYAGNNPVGNVDPTGLCNFDEWDFIGCDDMTPGQGANAERAARAEALNQADTVETRAKEIRAAENVVKEAPEDVKALAKGEATGENQPANITASAEDALPASPDARAVIDAVRNNQPSPFNFDNEGTEFRNQQGKLPAEPPGYYIEHGVPGDERIVVGANGEIYYTPDHYASFYLVEPGDSLSLGCSAAECGGLGNQ